MSSTVREAFTDYRYAIVGLSKQTQKDYIQKLGVFVDWCETANITLEQIKQVTIRRFIESVRGHKNQQGNSISSVTVRGYVIVLKTFLAWLANEEDYSELVSEKLASRVETVKV